MSKPIKKLMRDELVRRFTGVSQLAVVGLAGVDADTANQVRNRLRQKDIHVTVVKNALAKQAFRELGIERAATLLAGPSAIAYGADGVVTIVRELLEINQEAPNVTVKAAYMDGQVFGADQIEALSRYPTREEAIAQVLQCLLSPGANVSACLIGPGGQIAAILKAIEDRAGGAEGSQAA
jgi:large subunit ribosomal protein L10